MTKKLCLVVCLVIALSAVTFGFEKGTKSIGGSVGFSTYKNGDDYPSVSSFGLTPRFSYFVTKNLCLDIAPGFTAVWLEEQDTMTRISIGLGFRYFYKFFYGGAVYDYGKGGIKGYKSSSQFLTLSLGRLVGIAKNIYLDLGLVYKMGIGNNTTWYEAVPNDYRSLSAVVGVQLFFK